MKKQVINFNWPATLSFSADSGNENERFSRGKLTVFYRGETPDHRFFSEEFGNELVKSLPYTPIVSHYDEEKDDFVGHATQQDIYGIVDPCGEITFEQDDEGTVWCVCDTVYYTERPDKVGEIAKKIEGHSQSLELDPSTAKYKVNYDNKKHFKNIEFTAGHFVGVSVLGKDQKPAFTGSTFFSVDDQFENKMKLLREYCERQNDQTAGGNEMNLQEFMKLSWGDISIKVEESITTEYQEEYFTYIIDMFNDSAIAKFYSLYDGSCKLMRVNYSVDENGAITLGDVNEVHVVYEDIQAPAANVETGVEQASLNPEVPSEPAPTVEPSTEPIANDAEFAGCKPEEDKTKDDEEDDENDMACGDKDKKKCSTDEENKDDESKTSDDEEKKPCDDKTKCDTDAACADNQNAVENAAQVTNAEVTEIQQKASVENEQIQEENSGSATLAESERAEFESLKREKKVNLLNSYKDYLSDEEYVEINSTIDNFTDETLEVVLLKKYKSYTEEQTSKQPKIRVLSLETPLQNTSAKRDSLDDFISRNL